MNRLYRSRYDRRLTGLCGGIAQAVGVDSTLIRILLVIGTFITAGTVFWVYLIASLVVPKEPMEGYDGYGYGPTSYRGYRPKCTRHPDPVGPISYGSSHFGGDVSRDEFRPKKKEKHESPLDEMMDGLEKKALQKEIEELRSKVAKYEKGDL